MINLGAWLVGLASPIIRQILLSLGVGVITYVGVDLAISAAIDAVRSSLGGLSSSVAAVVGLAGFFEAVGIVAGGMMAGVTMMQLKRFARL